MPISFKTVNSKRKPRHAARPHARVTGKKSLVELKSYTVRADTDESFAAMKRLLDDLAGVHVKAEAPTRRAIAVEAPAKRNLPSFLKRKGLHVRDEVVYQAEDV